MVGPLFVICKSACGVIVVVTMALVEVPSLLVGTGSNVMEPLSARFVKVPLAGAVTVTVKFVVAPLVNVATGHVTSPFVKLKPELAVTKVTLDGNASVTTTLAAGEGPRLVNVIV